MQGVFTRRVAAKEVLDHDQARSHPWFLNCRIQVQAKACAQLEFKSTADPGLTFWGMRLSRRLQLAAQRDASDLDALGDHRRDPLQP